jgi:hypothetical protein
VEAFTTLSLAGLRNHGPRNVWMQDRWLWSVEASAPTSGHTQGTWQWSVDTDLQPDQVDRATALAGFGDLPRGAQRFRGIPFDISPDAGNPDAAWIVLGGDGWPRLPEAVAVPVGAKARHLLVCHFLDGIPVSQVRPDGPNAPGETVAEYVFIYGDGTRRTRPIRNRFEINPGRAFWGDLPFAAVQQFESLPHPAVGADAKGLTGMTESPRGSTTYLLAAIVNPEPDREIATLELRVTGTRTVTVAALTLSSLEHNPLQRSALTAVVADVPAPVAAAFDLGHITRTDPHPGDVPADWLDRPGVGAGTGNADHPATLIEGTAAPEATLTLKVGEQESTARWGDLLKNRAAATDDGRINLRVIEDRDTWVHVRTLDSSTGRETPTRVSFYGPRGNYLPPYGHQRDININWNEDIGGDLKLGDTNFAYVDGRFQIELPVGDVFVEYTKGFEYTPTRRRVTIAPGQRELTLEIDRWTDSKLDGYYTGDTHVHFLDPSTSVLEAEAEDLNVVNLLAAPWGRLFTNVENFTGALDPASKEDRLLWVGQENRHHMLGHMSLLGMKELVMPFAGGGPDEGYFGGAEEILMADWADAAHAQDALVVAPHFPSPHSELAADIALGKIDAAELKYFPPQLDGHSIGSWYRYLNCGYRLPAVGGSDKMTNSIPIGGVRTYARLGPDLPFTHENWRDAIRSGDTFSSTGPLIFLTVEGRPPGADINLPDGGGTLELDVTAHSALPFTRVEIVANGSVIADAAADPGGRSAHLSVKYEAGDSCWIAARCYGEIDLWHAWVNKVAAHTSPVYVTVGDRELFSPTQATFMLTLIEGGITYLEETAIYRDDDKRARHIGLFESARRAVHRRLHDHGIPH